MTLLVRVVDRSCAGCGFRVTVREDAGTDSGVGQYTTVLLIHVHTE